MKNNNKIFQVSCSELVSTLSCFTEEDVKDSLKSILTNNSKYDIGIINEGEEEFSNIPCHKESSLARQPRVLPILVDNLMIGKNKYNDYTLGVSRSFLTEDQIDYYIDSYNRKEPFFEVCIFNKKNTRENISVDVYRSGDKGSFDLSFDISDCDSHLYEILADIAEVLETEVTSSGGDTETFRDWCIENNRTCDVD